MVISFKSCLFTELIIENEEDIQFRDVSISFQNCFIRDIQVEHIISKNVSLSFHACMFSGRIAAPALSSVSINNCLLEYNVFLLDLQKVDVSYTTENIFVYLWIELFKKRGITKLESYLANLQRYYFSNIQQLSVRSNVKDTDKPGPYRMSMNTQPEYMVGYHLSKREAELLKVSVSIEFSGDGKDISTLLENLNLFSLSLTGNAAGRLSIEHVHTGNWYLSNFSPKGETSFYNIDPRHPHEEETKIGIHQCNLDKVNFDNVYFDQYDRLSFYRSKFSNSVFTSCSFPETYASYEKFQPNENVHYPEKRTANHHKDQYEIFLQLKKALEATGNNYEALKLQAVSQTALHKISNLSKADKFILWTSRVSNNHGLSILRPFLWFIGLTVSCYLLFLFSSGLLFKSTNFDPDLIGYYFSYIDITHKIDFLKEKRPDMNGFSLTLDYLGKLFTGYLAYQFVVAFRKYGKKS